MIWIFKANHLPTHPSVITTKIWMVSDFGIRYAGTWHVDTFVRKTYVFLSHHLLSIGVVNENETLSS